MEDESSQPLWAPTSVSTVLDSGTSPREGAGVQFPIRRFASSRLRGRPRTPNPSMSMTGVSACFCVSKCANTPSNPKPSVRTVPRSPCDIEDAILVRLEIIIERVRLETSLDVFGRIRERLVLVVTRYVRVFDESFGIFERIQSVKAPAGVHE